MNRAHIKKVFVGSWPEKISRMSGWYDHQRRVGRRNKNRDGDVVSGVSYWVYPIQTDHGTIFIFSLTIRACRFLVWITIRFILGCLHGGTWKKGSPKPARDNTSNGAPFRLKRRGSGRFRTFLKQASRKSTPSILLIARRVATDNVLAINIFGRWPIFKSNHVQTSKGQIKTPNLLTMSAKSEVPLCFKRRCQIPATSLLCASEV